MNHEDVTHPINFQTVVLPSIGFFIASVVSIYFENYWWAFIFFSCAILTILYLLLALSFVRTTIQRYALYLVYVLGFMGVFFLADWVGQYFNQRAALQQQCGIVQNIEESGSGRDIDTFEVVNNQKEVKFLYKYYKDQIQQYQNKVCVIYSFDKKWARSPYIHQIKQGN